MRTPLDISLDHRTSSKDEKRLLDTLMTLAIPGADYMSIYDGFSEFKEACKSINISVHIFDYDSALGRLAWIRCHKEGRNPDEGLKEFYRILEIRKSLNGIEDI